MNELNLENQEGRQETQQAEFQILLEYRVNSVNCSFNNTDPSCGHRCLVYYLSIDDKQQLY